MKKNTIPKIEILAKKSKTATPKRAILNVTQ